MLHCPIDSFHQKPHFAYEEDYSLFSNFHPKQEPFFKKDHFGVEESYGVDQYFTPEGLTPTGLLYDDLTPKEPTKVSVDLDKQEIFDYLRELKEELEMCHHDKRFDLRQDLFVSAVNALTHPHKDVVLIQMGQESVLRCVDSAIADLDVDFLNIGMIFLLRIYKPIDAKTDKDPTFSALDRKVMKVLNRRHEKSSDVMQNFARELPAPTLREDAIYLGNEFRRTFMNLVFQVRFEFLRKKRNEAKGKDLKKSKKSPRKVKKQTRHYQDRALVCCPGSFYDPPKTPFFKPSGGGFWQFPRNTPRY